MVGGSGGTDLFNLRGSEKIAAFILRVPCVALEPFPRDLVALSVDIQLAPEIGIFYRFPFGRHPTTGLPSADPFRDPLSEILRVGVDRNFARHTEFREAGNRSPNLHPVICRGLLPARDLLRFLTVAEYGRPATGAGISMASAIRKNRNFFQGAKELISAFASS